MTIFALGMAALVILFGFRLITMAMQTAFSGKVMVREGLHRKWQPAPTRNEAWKVACRDGLMGILLIVLGVFLVT